MAADNEQDSSSSQQPMGGSPSTTTNSFNKGMVKDYNETFIGEGVYTHARNAMNSSHDGQVGVIGNEPSNLFCINLPYSLVGCIHLQDDKWVVFTTNDTNSEIGIFDESACTYEALKSPEGRNINFTCLGLKKTNLITGVSRTRFDCDRLVYWDDGLNPTRILNVDKVPVLKSCTIVANCQQCVEIVSNNSTTIDCEAIRIAPFMSHPCIKIKKGEVSGTLPNGSYQACIGYLVDGVRVGDYLGLSDVQSLFVHDNVGSSLQIDITNIDTDYNEFELVILSNINAQGTAKIIGTYSTSQGTIYLDRWSNAEYTPIPISDVLLRSEPVERTDAMYTVNDYLIRTGVYSKFKFNYQPLANQIRAKWVVVEYPQDYYFKDNNRVGYMRDEQYAFFIRFIYNTGEFSESYHIPGRPPSIPSDTQTVAPGGDNIDTIGQPYWNIYNTATVTSTAQSSPTYLNGGKILATGDMGYWESTERYPADKPEIWNSFPNTPNSPLNLCGKAIRHHKMPDETRHPSLNIFSQGGNNIRLLGVQFENIRCPLDENGNPITSIVGYQILRGSRESNKSIVAKGIINNMREYPVPESPGITGLYQNYPYNDLRSDDYLTSAEQTGENGNSSKPSLTGYRKDYFSFHSPDTTFTNPYLNVSELKIYNLYSGTMNGYFQDPYRHPKSTQISNWLNNFFIIPLSGTMAALQTNSALLGGFDITLGSDKDVIKNTVGTPTVLGEGLFGVFATALVPAAALANAAAAIPFYGLPALTGLTTVLNALGINLGGIADLGNIFPGLNSIKQQLYNVFKQIIPKRQFARQFNSHGFYTESIPNTVQGNIRKRILDSVYLSSSVQQFSGPTLTSPPYQVNNTNRTRAVLIQTNNDVLDPKVINGGTQEETRYLISQPGNNRRLYSYYSSLKLSVPSQYGQLQSIKQLVISDCYHGIKPDLNARFSTSVLFGGDTYINRFTEKNTMFFFNTWLRDGEPADYEFNYANYPSLPYPKYWLNTEYNGTSFFSSPGNYRSLDYELLNPIGIFITRGAFYLFNSGVRDFFVESEVNLAYRDWEDDIPRRHYDQYRFTDLNLMFRSDIIDRSPNYYKYDYSLSVSKLVNSYVTWGSLLPRDYDPTTYSTCYKYIPTKVIYSLPQNEEASKDYWRLFLVNNYKQFPSRVSAIKPVNKTGALFMMSDQSPLQFLGVEELKLDQSGTKVTIGDGGLFTGPQQLQAIVNADQSYEYGSCQGRFCSINTLYGVFWVSQNQGKVFNYAGGLNDITNSGLKWWFAKYLPSQLLAMYPEYPLGDNPLIGVGTQLIYDNTYEIVYLVKKDYKPKFTNPTTLQLIGNTFYIAGTKTPVPLTNTQYFEEASFTISYDPKSKAWISFHDWIPSFLIPGRNHFMSVNGNSIWKHNIRCDSYCNFYGVEYPFEIEFVSSTGQQVTSMRNLEYMLEVYNYYNDCKDKFHVLDQNFDQAMVYNSEQVSGVLELSLKSKSNPLQMLTYPQIGTNSIKIQFSKEENKYRFNQFWDITKDRGEFSGANLPMFVTEANGYKFQINPGYVDYNKPPLQRKKFRHYVNRVFLRKHISGKNKFLFKISNQKLLTSYR